GIVLATPLCFGLAAVAAARPKLEVALAAWHAGGVALHQDESPASCSPSAGPARMVRDLCAARECPARGGRPRSVGANAVACGALQRELPACCCGRADPVAAPRPEGPRPAGRGRPPTPAAAFCPQTASFWHDFPLALAHTVAVLPHPALEPRPGRWTRRAEGVPLKAVE